MSAATRTLCIALAALALAAGAAGYVWLRPDAASAKFNAVDVTGADWGKKLDLLDHHGKRRTLADFRGKVVALFFGFTNCPDVCPTALATIARARALLGEEADQVQGLFVTVDPQRDTPGLLAKYVTAFDSTFLGLYGNATQTGRAAKEFKIYYQAQKPHAHGAYSVDHSGQIYVLDANGRLRLYIRSHDAAPEAIAHDLRLLIGE